MVAFRSLLKKKKPNMYIFAYVAGNYVLLA